jgi:hypothetical protein
MIILVTFILETHSLGKVVDLNTEAKQKKKSKSQREADLKNRREENVESKKAV